MGLFGGKKILVSSVCYNMAGDEADRPDYMKTMIASNVVAGNPRSSVTDSLRTGYLNGPSIKLRTFYRWAEDNYNSVVGLSSAGLAGTPDISPSLVASHVPAGAGDVVMQTVRVDGADFEVWAEKWVLDNHPAQFTGDWEADYNDTTNQIKVTLPGGAEHTFTPADFDKDGIYIYAAYNRVTEDGEGPLIEGDVITLAPGEPFPDTTGWTSLGGGVYERTEFLGYDGDGRIRSRRYTMYQVDSGGVRTVQTDEQDIGVREWSQMEMFIYKVGSGITALDDAIEDTTSTVGGFFAPIPVRLDNTFISEGYMPTQYAAAKKAYRRLTGGGKFDALIEKLEDNEDLPDLDYIYVVAGVSLNVQENASRRYIYEFFDQARLTSLFDESDYAGWKAGVEGAIEDTDAWLEWLVAQGSVGNPLNGAPEPDRTAYGSAPRNEIRVRSSSTLGYDTRIAWKAIKEDTGSGLGKSGAKVGEVWLEKGGQFSEVGDTYGGALGTIASDLSKSEDLLIWWQTGASSWKRLTIRGLVHQNFIYKGKYVEIGAHEALDDEDESGFIIPLHYDTWRSMSLRDTTQMATACVFLVINCYKVKKKKWYQTGIFKILLFIAIVVVSTIIFGPQSLLITGPLVTVTATAPLLIVLSASLANALTALIITKIIGMVAVEAFGEKIGSIIGAVVAFAALSVASGIKAGLSVAQVFTQMMNPVNLAMLANSLGEGIARILQVEVRETFAKTQDVLDQYSQQSKSISQLYEQNIGYGRGMFDPTMLLDSKQWFVEPGETFLARTLMTGSDIAELSNALVASFSDLTLSTDLPL